MRKILLSALAVASMLSVANAKILQSGGWDSIEAVIDSKVKLEHEHKIPSMVDEITKLIAVEKDDSRTLHYSYDILEKKFLEMLSKERGEKITQLPAVFYPVFAQKTAEKITSDVCNSKPDRALLEIGGRYRYTYYKDAEDGKHPLIVDFTIEKSDCEDLEKK